MVIFYILFSWMRRLVLGNMLTAAHKAYLKVVLFSPVSQSHREKKIVKKRMRRKSAVCNQFLYTTFAFVCSMKMNKVLNIENNVDVVKHQFPDTQKRSSFCLLCHEFGSGKKKREKMMNLVFIDAFHVLNKDQPHSQNWVYIRLFGDL